MALCDTDSVAETPLTGWYSDPYRHHEVRWMSQGTPTSLVRDGLLEGSDPVGDEPFEVPPFRMEDGRTQNRGRNWGLWLVVLGVVAVIGGHYLLETSSAFPTHTFVPSSAELGVVSRGGTANPPGCTSSGASEGPGLAITEKSANTEFTVYPHSVIEIFDDPGFTSEISSKAPVCDYAASFAGAETTASYLFERPGEATVYFISEAAHVYVVKILVTASSPPSSTPGWVLLTFGALAIVSGVAVIYRRDRGGPNDDLRRADDAGSNGRR
jgi:hypothetical protein